MSLDDVMLRKKGQKREGGECTYDDERGLRRSRMVNERELHSAFQAFAWSNSTSASDILLLRFSNSCVLVFDILSTPHIHILVHILFTAQIHNLRIRHHANLPLRALAPPSPHRFHR